MRILLNTFILLTLIGCNEAQTKKEDFVRPIAWTKVTASSLEQSRTISGVVMPVETADLSFEVSGKIRDVKVTLGSEVKKGQILALLDTRNFELAIQSSKAEVDKAKAALAETENEYFRYKRMIEKSLISQSEFDNAKATYESSKSSVDVTVAKLDIVQKDLQDSILIAPYDGTITKRFIEPSQQISSGNVAFEIEGTHGFEVHIMVPETLIQEVNQGELIQVSVSSLTELNFRGKISEIGTRAESASAFPVTIALLDNNSQLRAGMTAEVKFVYLGQGRTGHEGEAVLIPISALLAQLDQKVSVFVFDEQAQVVRQRLVQTENIINNQVYISQGLVEGEIIAISGVAFLRDGQRTKLLVQQIQLFN